MADSVRRGGSRRGRGPGFGRRGWLDFRGWWIVVWVSCQIGAMMLLREIDRQLARVVLERDDVLEVVEGELAAGGGS